MCGEFAALFFIGIDNGIVHDNFEYAVMPADKCCPEGSLFLNCCCQTGSRCCIASLDTINDLDI